MTGTRYETVKDLSTTEIAKLIRKDIKKEHPEIKCSVISKYYAGGSSIDIYIKEMPFNPINPDFDFENGFTNDITPQYTEQFKTLEADVEAIHNKYNYNKSDAMVDYFDVNYYGSVNLDYEAKKVFIAQVNETKKNQTKIVEQAEVIITETPEQPRKTSDGKYEIVKGECVVCHDDLDCIDLGFGLMCQKDAGLLNAIAKAVDNKEIKTLTEQPEAATSSDSKFDAQLIVIERAEGLHELCVTRTFKTFADANAWLLGNSETYPKNGSYDKHDFTVIFTNGQKYEGRLDCQHASMPDPDLSVNKHMIEHLNWLSGRTQNPHCGETEYQKLMTQYEADGLKQQAEEWLNNYNL